MKILLIASLVVFLVGVVPSVSGEDVIDYTITVNQTMLEDMVHEFGDWGANYIETTKSERKELMSSLKDAYKNTAAKLILNFGKTIAPVAKEWAELMYNV
jgi:hypothetical protein